MEFAEKIKYVRKAMGVTQDEFAKLLEVSFATINRLENGRAVPSYSTMIKFEELCKARGIKPEL